MLLQILLTANYGMEVLSKAKKKYLCFCKNYRPQLLGLLYRFYCLFQTNTVKDLDWVAQTSIKP